MIPYVNQDYYDNLIQFYKVLGTSKCALEIGLGWGTSAQAYLDTFPESVLYSVEQADYHGIFEKMHDIYKDRLGIIVGKSPGVFTTFPLFSFDFIYIDGAHDFWSASSDILNTWARLVRGGVMAFDDYGQIGLTEEGKPHGVKEAVDEFMKDRVQIFNRRNLVAYRKE
jgi:predicted O-methyltransferase YrrM